MGKNLEYRKAIGQLNLDQTTQERLQGAVNTGFENNIGDLETGNVTPAVVVSGTYTASVDDLTIICDTSGGGFTVNLPTASLGKRYHIINISTNTATIDPADAETIGAATETTLLLEAEEDAASIEKTTSTNWRII